MLNVWNTAALVYLMLLLLGTMWTFEDNNSDKDKSMTRLTIELWAIQAIMLMWVFSMVAFPLFLMLGQYASSGDVWGLIKVR